MNIKDPHTKMNDADAEALRIHGGYFYSDSDSGKSDFDEEYYHNKPPPVFIHPTQIIVVRPVDGQCGYHTQQMTDSSLSPLNNNFNSSSFKIDKKPPDKKTGSVGKYNHNIRSDTENIDSVRNPLNSEMTNLLETPIQVVSEAKDQGIRPSNVVKSQPNVSTTICSIPKNVTNEKNTEDDNTCLNNLVSCLCCCF